MTISVRFAELPASERQAAVEQLVDAMEAADKAGCYPQVTVERPWLEHNPVLEGEFASPGAIRWYLERELGELAAAGARISVSQGRKELPPATIPTSGVAKFYQTTWDLRRKKLFLFAPERMALSINRLEHYTGTPAEQFQRYVRLMNDPARRGVPLRSCRTPQDRRPMAARCPHGITGFLGRAGITIINIGVGPSNAKTITDHLAVLRPVRAHDRALRRAAEPPGDR